jgi:endonuclease/exonuclease/phosphatase family metal-dependent hydrolase
LREKSPSTVRVMTWNIHGAVGRNRRFDLAGVVELIQRWDADVVALQEVDSRRKVWGRAFQPCQFFEGSPVGDRDEAFFDLHNAATLP